MKTWQALHTAFVVAEAGTISRAATRLNCQRSTIIRHIDIIETWLGNKLFIRHAKGYDLTEAGHQFTQSMKVVEQQILSLRSQLSFQAETVSGTLVISGLEPLFGLFAPAIARFADDNPLCRVEIQSSTAFEPLEKGQVQIALRTGKKTDVLDYVPVNLGTLRFGIFGHETYMAKYGTPETTADLVQHRFICPPIHNPRIPFSTWFDENVSPAQVAATSSHAYSTIELISEGIGLGVAPLFKQTEHMVRILPMELNWETNVWAVSHLSLYQTPKVQKIIECLKNNPQF